MGSDALVKSPLGVPVLSPHGVKTMRMKPYPFGAQWRCIISYKDTSADYDVSDVLSQISASDFYTIDPGEAMWNFVWASINGGAWTGIDIMGPESSFYHGAGWFWNTSTSGYKSARKTEVRPSDVSPYTGVWSESRSYGIRGRFIYSHFSGTILEGPSWHNVQGIGSVQAGTSTRFEIVPEPYVSESESSPPTGYQVIGFIYRLIWM
jgi:hypothetical protein